MIIGSVFKDSDALVVVTRVLIYPIDHSLNVGYPFHAHLLVILKHRDHVLSVLLKDLEHRGVVLQRSGVVSHQLVLLSMKYGGLFSRLNDALKELAYSSSLFVYDEKHNRQYHPREQIRGVVKDLRYVYRFIQVVTPSWLY